MTVKEMMERTGTSETGKIIAYIKDALDEMALISPTHFTKERFDISTDQRFYDKPKDAIQILHIRCKNHGNTEGIYKEIPRMVYEPEITDTDGV